MRKKFFIVYGILIVIFLKLAYTFFTNEFFISKYEKGTYDIKQVRKLLSLNLVESYIAHYNYGNALYKNQDYDGAIKEYRKALNLFPPEDRECSIRINLVLAMLAKIDDNASNDEKIKSLEEARKTICENGCANEKDDNGHSQKAETLKKDIDELIEKLKNNAEEQTSSDDSSQDEEPKAEEAKEIQEKLQEIQKEARQERLEDFSDIDVRSQYDYSFHGKQW